MTTPHEPHESTGGEPPIDTDLLLSRAVAGDRNALAEVRARGAADPAILEELALWQADELRLARVGRTLDARADRIEAPRRGILAGRQSRLGWFVAAAIALAWLGQSLVPSARDSRGTARQQASVAGLGAGFATADEAFDAYLAKAREEGLVEGDVAPPTLLRSRELTDGRGFEVVIVRQIIERRVSPEIYRVAPMGETGRLRQILVRPRTETVQ
jgi:hypothetical protein